jgi:hypothetical protein
LPTELLTAACQAFRLVGGQRSANDWFGQSVGDLTIRDEIGLDVPLHRERNISVADPFAERLPVDP